MNMAEAARFQPAFPQFLGTAVSAESERAAQVIRDIVHKGSATIFKSARAHRIASAIADLTEQYSEDGWDGYNAKAIKPETLARAESFLNSLPFALPFPEVIPEPTGEVAFEWRTKATSLFVVSIADTGRLVYAGRFGMAKGNGVDYFSGGIPAEILSAIRRVIG